MFNLFCDTSLAIPSVYDRLNFILLFRVLLHIVLIFVKVLYQLFSENLWCGLLDYVTAYADGRLVFRFKNGSEFEG